MFIAFSLGKQHSLKTRVLGNVTQVILNLRCYPWIFLKIYKTKANMMKQHMAGVQNSRSKGLYKVGPIGIQKLILHLRYEAGPIGNHAVHKLGASIALAWR